MHSPLEKKFNEYVGNIHSILHSDVIFLNEPAFVNQLLDKMEFLKRNFVIMNSITDDVYVYQDRLSVIATHSRQTLEWVYLINVPSLQGASTFSSLKENLFMLNDLFETSQNLIKSFYPVA